MLLLTTKYVYFRKHWVNLASSKVFSTFRISRRSVGTVGSRGKGGTIPYPYILEFVLGAILANFADQLSTPTC